ncbi:hypothetical protein J3Q64DRAFT_1761472 [Phycomyces blakesleeanus]|uniref:Transmembrane protein UsgS n=2 Tax=Phycomyces blakesleeanus TaxID=4837 RepID=A0A162TQW6_PHYB8|nr:hypothetical protein PHYBLDRAFT_127411 [Phycomyces blakesleeanus NRRL 1555(-)]OAD69083.1 hypothetical protein PHYBLDRAFT_127411 [Phycomyces blakesleeanus NRRL 1555(-)]|eukprot:XP_018287123.1 hypothetical protein PHYBLDRAFT_127411 [Phycomyces blakesleeanus NRRL 1555(-)]
MARWTLTGLLNGAEYAVQGIAVVIKNPNLRKQKFLRIFLYLSLVSIVLFCITKLLIAIPLFILRVVFWLFSSYDSESADAAYDKVTSILREIVSSVPFLTLLFMRYIYAKPLDDLFVESLAFVDSIHPERKPYTLPAAKREFRKEHWANMKDYVFRTWKKLRLGVAICLLSLLPVVGQFVFPAAGAYATFKSLGNTQGIAVGLCFFFLPRWAVMRLVRALIGMRSLTRELLEPYFARMNMSHSEKRKWFSGRKDILFGFSAIAYIIIRIPYVGFIGYGIAQAAAAYMLTTVTDPPNDINTPEPVNDLAVAENTNDSKKDI